MAEEYETRKYNRRNKKRREMEEWEEEKEKSGKFRPEINQYSARLDQKNRELPRHDRLYKLSEMKKREIEKKRIQKIEEEMEREEELLRKHKKKVKKCLNSNYF